jgi:hypothetical protein
MTKTVLIVTKVRDITRIGQETKTIQSRTTLVKMEVTQRTSISSKTLNITCQDPIFQVISSLRNKTVSSIKELTILYFKII